MKRVVAIWRHFGVFMRLFSIAGMVAVLAMMAACNSARFSDIEAVLPDMKYKSAGGNYA